MNRHHFFLTGLVLLYLGLQFRFVETFVLNSKTSTFLAQRFGSETSITANQMARFLPTSMSGPITRSVTPPEWIGWALISIGSVLVLHALAMPKPGQK